MSTVMCRKLLNLEGQDGGWQGEELEKKKKKKKTQGGHLRELGNPNLFFYKPQIFPGFHLAFISNPLSSNKENKDGFKTKCEPFQEKD